MPNETALSDDDPRMIAWKVYTATPEFKHTRHWAQRVGIKEMPGERAIQVIGHSHLDGSLWAVFQAGYQAATENQAKLHAMSAADPRWNKSF